MPLIGGTPSGRQDLIAIRRGTSAAWTSVNPILAAGEQGYETDTRKRKTGDGATPWVALAYEAGGTGGGATALVDLSDLSTANLPAANNPLNTALASRALITRTVNGQPLSADVLIAKSDVGLSAVDNTSDANKPVSTAQATAIATKQATLVSNSNIKTINGVSVLGSGDITIAAGAPISVAYSTTIPLDVAGNGKYMAQTTLAANSTFTVGSSPLEQGNCNFSLLGDGSHAPNFGAFFNANGYVYNSGLGANNVYAALYTYGVAELYGHAGQGVDVTAPTLVSATVADTDATKINLVWSESVNATVSASAAFTVSAGHALTAHTYVTPTTSYLTTSTPFVQGETARTLAYTQPGSNKMQDLAGNLLANITAASITNSVTNPQISAIAVQNSTPSRIDLTWSDTISSTIPAASAFAVSSGHALTAHTYVDPTHTYLTTSTAFTGGESAKTLTYTVPGTNPIKDLQVPANLGLGITGASITNNVAGGTTWNAAVAADSPIAWYKLDEANFSSPLADSSGNGYTVNNLGGTGPTFGQTPVFAGSVSSVLFTVAGAQVMVSAAPVQTGSFSLECNFNLTNLTQVNALCGWDTDAPGCGARLRVTTTGAIQFDVVYTSPSIAIDTCISTTGVVSAGTAYHCVAKRASGSAMEIWLNGSMVATLATTNTGTRNGNAFTIGSSGSDGYFCAGKIDELLLYSAALSSTRIGVHYGARNT